MGQIATVIVYGALVAASYALEMPLVKRSFEIFITNIGFLAGILRLGIGGVKSSLFPSRGRVRYGSPCRGRFKVAGWSRISPTSRPLLEPAAPE
jgi:hypothetical protein